MFTLLDAEVSAHFALRYVAGWRRQHHSVVSLVRGRPLTMTREAVQFTRKTV